MGHFFVAPFMDQSLIATVANTTTTFDSDRFDFIVQFESSLSLNIDISTTTLVSLVTICR